MGQQHGGPPASDVVEADETRVEGEMDPTEVERKYNKVRVKGLVKTYRREAEDEKMNKAVGMDKKENGDREGTPEEKKKKRPGMRNGG